MSKATGVRAHSGGNLVFELEGKFVGWLFGFEGGLATAEVVPEKVGPHELSGKHISTIKYEDMTVTCGAAMSKLFFDWMMFSLEKRNYQRKSGAIIGANYDYKETSRVDFMRGLISEMTFPACDAASRDAAKLQVKISPECTKWKLTPNGGNSIKGPISEGTQKRWLPRNFSFDMQGFFTKNVAKVDPITLKQKVLEYPVGEYRDPFREPTAIEYPNVSISLPEVDAQAFFDWYEDFVVRGNCGQDQERTAELTYLFEDKKTSILRVEMQHLGIFKITPDKFEANNESIRRVKIDMYCENMVFRFERAHETAG